MVFYLHVGDRETSNQMGKIFFSRPVDSDPIELECGWNSGHITQRYLANELPGCFNSRDMPVYKLSAENDITLYRQHNPTG